MRINEIVHVLNALKREKYNHIANKLSRNGIVPMASGIRVESKERLKLVVDHLLSDIRKKVDGHEALELMWKEGLLSHPWTATLASSLSMSQSFYYSLAHK